MALVDDLGLSTLAELWADRPARSLPGALWRLYALREWVRRDPVGASADYAAGIRFADVPHVVAGVADPPGPAELKELTDAILTGVFDGRPGHRAGACGRVLPGRGRGPGRTVPTTPTPAVSTTRWAARPRPGAPRRC